jgi:hypothetical protein
MTVELGNVVLTQLTQVSIQERAHIVQHPVPGLSGDLTQTLGRSSVVVSLRGIFYGESVGVELKQLRRTYLAHQPVDFFTEAVGEGYFTQVLITRLDVSQRVEFPNQFDFVCQVVEYVEPPEPVTTNPLASLDTELTAEAVAFMDDVQTSLQQVEELSNLATTVPNFGNPAENLRSLHSSFVQATAGSDAVLSAIRSVLGTPVPAANPEAAEGDRPSSNETAPQ